jgi:hypothetical protein
VPTFAKHRPPTISIRSTLMVFAFLPSVPELLPLGIPPAIAKGSHPLSFDLQSFKIPRSSQKAAHDYFSQSARSRACSSIFSAPNCRNFLARFR